MKTINRLKTAMAIFAIAIGFTAFAEKQGTVTLNAKPVSGMVFAGWYTDSWYSEPFTEGSTDYRNTQLTYDVNDEDSPLTLYPYFVSTDLDIAGLSVESIQDSYPANDDGSFSLNLLELVDSWSLPKLAVATSGGFKYDAKTGVLSGMSTTPGSYKISVKATNSSITKPTADTTKDFWITVANICPDELLMALAGCQIGKDDELLVGSDQITDVASALKSVYIDNGWTVAAKNLPSGMTYKNGVFSGVATKDGLYTVTFTATKKGQTTQTATLTFKVVFPSLKIDIQTYGDPSAAGTVTGAGKYPAGKSVTLKATPAKNCVFAGWYEEDGMTPLSGAIDYRNTSYSYTTTTEDVTLVAKFATKEEDMDIYVPDFSCEIGKSGIVYDVDVLSEIMSVTMPTVTIKGLPPGLTYDAKTGIVSGKVTATGTYTVTLTVSNASVKNRTYTFVIDVPSLAWSIAPAYTANGAETPFYILTSPDNVWQFYCARGDMTIGGENDFAIAYEDMVWNGEYYEKVGLEEYFGSKYDEQPLIKGSGVLTLPAVAVDAEGYEYTIGVDDWTLESWNKATVAITKVIMPEDFTGYFGEGNTLSLSKGGFAVAAENPRYYSDTKGVLYVHGEYTGDGRDRLLAVPNSITGTYTIPEGVEYVQPGSFENTKLAKIVINSDLEEFGSDHEVSTSLKEIDCSENDRFTFKDGIFYAVEDEGNWTVLMSLGGVLKGTVTLPSNVTRIAPYALAYDTIKVTDFVFTSPSLSLGHGAIKESGVSGSLDFSRVGTLSFGDEYAALTETLAKTIKFPADTQFAYNFLDLDEAKNLTDIYWPTSYGFYDGVLQYLYVETSKSVKLHVRYDAGDWDDADFENVTVVKDLYPVFFNLNDMGDAMIDEEARFVVYSQTVGTLPVPTRPGYQFDGWYTEGGAKVAATAKVTGESTYYAHWSASITPVVMEGCEDMGTVSGGGVVAEGKTTTLKATAKTGYVFAGWYDEYDMPLYGDVDYRNPTYTYTSTGEPTMIYAMFATKEEDMWIDVDDFSFDVGRSGIVDSVDILDGIWSVSLPTVTVKGLPSGLTYDAKTGIISGKATVAGTYTVTLTVSNASVKNQTSTFTIDIPSLAWSIVPAFTSSGEETPFYILSSPDGVWQFYGAMNDEGGFLIADRAVVYTPYGEEEEDLEDYFGSQYDDNAIIKGSGVLTLPEVAVDENEQEHSVGIRQWALCPSQQVADGISKIVIPEGFSSHIGYGNVLPLSGGGYQVAEGNARYYSDANGVLYERSGFFGGSYGDTLVAVPSSLTGTYTIPDGVTAIMAGAFDMTKLTSIVFNSEVDFFGYADEYTSLGADCYVGKTLISIDVSNNPYFEFKDGILYWTEDEGATLTAVWGLPSKLSGTVTLPYNVVSIGEAALAYDQIKVTDFIFTSEHLSIFGDSIAESGVTGSIDLGRVGNLEIYWYETFEETLAKVVKFPVSTMFPEMWDDENETIVHGLDFGPVKNMTDIYWPVEYVNDLTMLFDGKKTIKLHILESAVDYPEYAGDAKVVNDLVRISLDMSGEVYAVKGQTIGNLPTPVLPGFQFDGWYTAPEGGTKITATTKVTGDVMYYAHWSAAIVPVVMPGCEDMGTVSGGGVVAEGKTTTLKATANKGYVFAGWFFAGSHLEGEYRNPTYTYTSMGQPTEIEAKFIPSEEDFLLLGDASMAEGTGYMDLNMWQIGYEIMIPVTHWFESVSMPTLTFTGLPSWLTYNANDGVLRGTPTAASCIYGTVSAQNASGYKAVIPFKIMVMKADGSEPDNGEVDTTYSGYGEMLRSSFLASGGLKVGTTFSSEMASLLGYYDPVMGGLSAAPTGLPTGFTVNKTTWSDGSYSWTEYFLSGTATKAGWYTVSASYKDMHPETGKLVTTKATVMIPVMQSPSTYVNVVAATSGGTVTGGGVLDSGVGYTIKATPDLGYVFAGWFFAGSPLEGEYRNPTYTYNSMSQSAVGQPAQIEAHFIPSGEDYLRLEEAAMAEGMGYMDVGMWQVGLEVVIPVTHWFESASMPTMTFSGLPSWLTYNANEGALRGTPTTASCSYCTVSVQNASGYKAVVPFKIVVMNTDGSEPDNGEVDTTYSGYGEMFRSSFLASGALKVGVEIEMSGSGPVGRYDSEMGGMTAVPTGLPTGLASQKQSWTYDSSTWTEYWIYGTPTKAGWYAVSASYSEMNPETMRLVTTKATIKVPVMQMPSTYVTIAAATSGGTVTGGGVWDAGVAYQITATPDTGYVFAGWYLDEGCMMPQKMEASEVDYRTASQKISTNASALSQGDCFTDRLYAKFMPASQADSKIALFYGLPYDPEPTMELEEGILVGFDWEVVLKVVCDTAPTVKVTGLPSSLVATALYDDGRFDIAYPDDYSSSSSSRLAPGDYPITVSITTPATKKSLTRKFILSQPVYDYTWFFGGLGSDDAPLILLSGMQYDDGMTWSDRLGIPVPMEPAAYTLSNLPKGLSYNSKTGVINGNLASVTVSTTYLVKAVYTDPYSGYKSEGYCKMVVEPRQ